MCKIASWQEVQGAQLSALCDLGVWDGVGVGGRLKRDGIYAYIQLIRFLVQQKMT